jgi:hypothetical protein
MNAELEDKLQTIKVLSKKIDVVNAEKERLLFDIKQLKRTSNSSNSMLNNFNAARNRDFFMEGSRYFGRSSELNGISEIKKQIYQGNIGSIAQDLRGSEAAFFGGSQDSGDLTGDPEMNNGSFAEDDHMQ